MKLVILPQSSTVQKVLDVIAGPAHVAKSQISPEMLTKFDQFCSGPTLDSRKERNFQDLTSN